MASFTDEQLMEIIAGGESDRVEFKESLRGEGPKKIRQAVCAFANDLPGHEQPGMVFVGVGDKGVLLGEPVTDNMLLQLANMKTDGNIVPPPSFSVEKRVLHGKEVGVVVVQPSNSTPVRYKGTIQIRIGSRRGIATAQDELILNEKRQHGDRPYDIKPIAHAGISDLSLGLFEHEYLVKAFSEDVLKENDRTLEEQMAATKMIDSIQNPVPTVLGLLTIGRKPKDFLHGSFFQFVRIDGVDLGDNIMDNREFEGNIKEIVQNLDFIMSAHNRTFLKIGTGLRDEKTHLYPLEALQQITRNAILHRNYQSYTPAKLHWFNDRIEVISPGGPFGDVTPQNFGEPGLASYRNPNLADAMKTLDIVQRFGYGLRISAKLLAESGNPPMKFKVDNNFVRVTIEPNPNYLALTGGRL